MTEEELRETEYRGYKARLANQQKVLADLRRSRESFERACAATSNEINITKRKMCEYEKRAASSA